MKFSEATYSPLQYEYFYNISSVIDRNAVVPEFKIPSASNNVVKLESPVARHDVMDRVHLVDLDVYNAGVESVALSDRSRGTMFHIHSTFKGFTALDRYSI